MIAEAPAEAITEPPGPTGSTESLLGTKEAETIRGESTLLILQPLSSGSLVSWRMPSGAVLTRSCLVSCSAWE